MRCMCSALLTEAVQLEDRRASKFTAWARRAARCMGTALGMEALQLADKSATEFIA